MELSAFRTVIATLTLTPQLSDAEFYGLVRNAVSDVETSQVTSITRPLPSGDRADKRLVPLAERPVVATSQAPPAERAGFLRQALDALHGTARVRSCLQRTWSRGSVAACEHVRKEGKRETPP